MLRYRLLPVTALSCTVFLGSCGGDSGTGPEPSRNRTETEQLSDRPVAVKTTSIAPQFFDQQLSAPAAGEAMTAEAAEAFIAGIQDPQVDVERLRSRFNDPAVQSRVEAPGLRLALAYVSEYSPEVWEQVTTATSPSGRPLVGLLEFSRLDTEEWNSGTIYARAYTMPQSDQMAYMINDLYAAEDPRLIGTLIAHELLAHPTINNSRHAEALGNGLQSHIYAMMVKNDPELATQPTRLTQILNQLAIWYMMGTPAAPGSNPAAQGIMASNGNRPLVPTSTRLTQRSFLSLFEAMGGDPVPGSAITGRAYQHLLSATAACPTEVIDATTTSCVDGQIGAWSMVPHVLADRIRLADIFSLDLKKTEP